MMDLLAACDLMEAAGHTHVPIPITEVRKMAARIGKAKITEKAGRTRVEPKKPHRDLSKRIGAKKSADRKEAGYRKNRGRA
jgi:hypothetical protein